MVNKNDLLAKQYKLMIGVPGELYMKSVNYSTTVYIEHVGGLWVASRLGYYSNGSSSYEKNNEEFGFKASTGKS